LIIVLPVLAVALLYAYRAQTPATEQVAYSAVLNEVQEGKVRAVIVEGNRAAITLADGRRQLVTVPDGDETLARAVLDRNRSDPAHLIELRYEGSAPSFGIAGAVVLSLLPVVLLVAVILFAASAFSRARAPHRYELVTKLADLRDRGAITEEEFQREKRRVFG